MPAENVNRDAVLDANQVAAAAAIENDRVAVIPADAKRSVAAAAVEVNRIAIGVVNGNRYAGSAQIVKQLPCST